MRVSKSDKIIAWMALLSGLSISAVAIYYSVAGLVSIFAAAAVPIIVMGVVLEVGKLVATVWLKQNWMVAPRFLKSYLLIAITVLMLITSMGIFGYLSKAHLDQAVPTGDVADKVALIDEKIKTERDNIEAARKALEQMNAQVDQRLSRSDDEKGAERAVQIRRAQARERQQLQNDIAGAQKKIAQLNEERAPIAKELRKVEAEVGPIKYIAALIYGDNPDGDLLERAVRWVIIIIVLVFDPLAIILLLASQYSFNWFRQKEEELPAEGDSPEVAVDVVNQTTVTEPLEEKSIFEIHPYLNRGFKYPEGWGSVPPQVYKPEEEKTIVEPTPAPLPEVVEETNEDNLIVDSAEESEKAAMARWKNENPDSSLKLQRQLLEKGIIKELPWMQYLRPEADYQEEESKKKDSELDGEGRPISDKENNREVGYKQNSEQNAQTLWQRIKARNDR
jgi:hypothetical protein